MSIRYLRLAFGGFALAWTSCVVAQTDPFAEEQYVPDLSQSFVQDLDQPREAAPVAEPAPLITDMYEPLSEANDRVTALRNCQDYEQAVIVDGDARVAIGTACQTTEGYWQVVSAPSLTGARALGQRPSGICREFQQPNVAVGEAIDVYGTACQRRDGVWEFIAASDAGDRYPAREVCRSYEQEIMDGNRSLTAHGRACEQPDGSWRVVSAPELGSERNVFGDGRLDSARDRYASERPNRLWEEAAPAPRTFELEYRGAPIRREPPRSERSYADARSGIAESLDRAASVIMQPFRPPSYVLPEREYRSYPEWSPPGRSGMWKSAPPRKYKY